MNKVLCVQFNQDQGLFSCCLENGGVRIFNVNPLAEQTYLKKDTVGTVTCCSMLRRSNLLALVSGGSDPHYPSKNVMIYDHLHKDFVLEYCLPDPVLNVFLQTNRILVVLRTSVHVFTFPNCPKKLISFDTLPNPRGLGLLSRDLLLFPGMRKGAVQTYDLSQLQMGISFSPTFIQAHQNEIACMAVDSTGAYLATGSVQGTLIRVFDLSTRIQMLEFRRGTDSAGLYCLNFSLDSSFLCCSSNKGTVHVFALKNLKLNKRSVFSGLTLGLSQYMDSAWSVGRFTVPADVPSICSFVNQNTVVAVCVDGTFHRLASRYTEFQERLASGRVERLDDGS